MAGRSNNYLRICVLAGLLLSFGASNTFAQVRAGAAYLKLLPGTRQQNLAGSVTAGLDQPYSLYANPAAAGMLRYWQFSTSYNRWIAGLSNASVLLGLQLRPWRSRFSDRLNVAAAISRQGLGQFDATAGARSSVDASDWWASTTVGLPLFFSGHQLSFGTTARYFSSNLASYHASALMFDFGVLYRSSRFWLDRSRDFRGILSVGLAVNHLGSDLTFISQATPLPKTWRAGVAANLGKHDGLQVQLLADVNQIRDEEAKWGLGAEFHNFLTLWPSLGEKWSRAFSLRTGYRISDKQNSRIVSKFSIGLSFRIDDYGSSLRAHSDAISRNNSSLRSDAGFLNSSVFRNVYQGTFSWYPIGPEPFKLVADDHHSFVPNKAPSESYWLDERVSFSWQPARDPDLFDEVNYLLVLAADRQQVEDKITELTSGDTTAVTRVFLRQPAVNQPDTRAHVTFMTLVDLTNGHAADPVLSALAQVHGKSDSVRTDSGIVVCRLPAGLEPGDYYWGVLAYDCNLHLRAAGGQATRIGRFHIKMRPDLTVEIDGVHLDPTARDYVANLTLRDKNGTIAADDSFYVDAYADTLREFSNGGFSARTSGNVVSKSPSIAPATRLQVMERGPHKIINGEPIVKKINWPRKLPHLKVTINEPPTVVEADSFFVNNFAKDTLDWHDLRVTRSLKVQTHELPAQFSPSKARVPFGARLELQRLAQAFNAVSLRNLCIQIDGHTDSTPWKNMSPAASDARNQALSQTRADSVAEVLVANGVARSRIIAVGHGSSKPKPGAIQAANRRVEITLLGTPGGPAPACKTGVGTRVRAVNSGALAIHRITIQNSSRGLPARGVRLVETTPVNVQVRGFSPRDPDSTRTLADGSQQHVWRFAELPAGASRTITFHTTKLLDSFGAERVTFSSKATSDKGFEDDASDNGASAQMVVLGQPFSRHVVQCGDDLDYLASYYYGQRDTQNRKESSDLILESNRSRLRRGSRPAVGDTLTILNVVKPPPPLRTISVPATLDRVRIDYAQPAKREIPIPWDKLVARFDYSEGCGTTGRPTVRWYKVKGASRIPLQAHGNAYQVQPADACYEIHFEVTAPGGVRKSSSTKPVKKTCKPGRSCPCE